MSFFIFWIIFINLSTDIRVASINAIDCVILFVYKSLLLKSSLLNLVCWCFISCYLQGQGHNVRALRKVTVCSMSFELLYLLAPNLVCCCIIPMQTGLWESACFSIRSRSTRFEPLIVFHHHHHHHHLFLNREGRWGTTDDFATSFLHLSLFSRNWRTPGLSIPWCCLPTPSSVCLWDSFSSITYLSNHKTVRNQIW